MKVIREYNGKNNAVTYYPVSAATGERIPCDGYPKTTPAAARREGEEVLARWAIQSAARKTGKYDVYSILCMGRKSIEELLK